MCIRKKILPCGLLCLLPATRATALGCDSVTVVVEPPASYANEVTQRVVYCGLTGTYSLWLSTAFFNPGRTDSFIISRIKHSKAKFKDGGGFILLNISNPTDDSTTVNAPYLKLLQRWNREPVGLYKTEVLLRDSSGKEYRQEFIRVVDTLLPLASQLRADANKTFFSSLMPKGSPTAIRDQDPKQLELSLLKLKRKYRKDKDLHIHSWKSGQGESYAVFTYKEYLLGTYELSGYRQQKHRSTIQSKAIQQNLFSAINTDISAPSPSFQLRNMSKTKSRETLEGRFEWTSHYSNVPDPGSGANTQYTDISGAVSTEIAGLPVVIEGYYTTQDKNRASKASFIRFHYDVSKAKNQLQQIVQGYRTKMNEASERLQSMPQLYSNYLKQLDAERNNILAELKAQKNAAVVNAGNVRENASKTNVPQATTESIAHRGKDSLNQKIQSDTDSLKLTPQQIAEREQRLRQIEEKRNNYERLLHQYRDQLKLDSMLNCKPLKKFRSSSCSTYKDWADAGSGLLPDGKTKQFVNGLTHLEAGILNVNESDYTLSGQTLKGMSVGYDFSVFKTGFSVGTVEYTTRDGSTEQFSTYLLRLDAAEMRGQSISFLYNGYAPDPAQFKGGDLSGEVDKVYNKAGRPAHVLSMIYSGALHKNITFDNESAVSFRPGGRIVKDMESAAVKTAVTTTIPKIQTDMKLEWEHIGATFENRTLPFPKYNTERFTLASGSDLFHALLNVRVDLNILEQHSFSGVGRNIKCGFEAKTNFRQYPNLQFSYKPFSLFHSGMVDSSAPVQRLSYGAVCMARTSYHWRYLTSAQQVALTYNTNKSVSDSVQNANKALQITYSYTEKRSQLTIGCGWMSTHSANAASIDAYSLAINFSTQFFRRLICSVGDDIATENGNIRKLGAVVGLAYKSGRLPLCIKWSTRYTHIRRERPEVGRSDVLAAQLGATWEFKNKNNNK